MKVCPICQTTYEDGVDFCFKDGAPLEVLDAGLPSEDVESTVEGVGHDEFEPPDAISLSNLPAVEPEGRAADLTSFESADSSVPPDHVTERGASDPFGIDPYDVPDAIASQHDLAVLSVADLPADDEVTQRGITAGDNPDVVSTANNDVAAVSEEARDLGPAVDYADEDIEDEDPESEATAVAPPPESRKHSVSRKAPTPPARTGRAATEDEDSGGSKLGIIAVACLLLVGVIGFLLFGGGGGEPTAAVAPTPQATPAPAPTPEPTPAPTPEPLEETPDADAEVSEGELGDPDAEGSEASMDADAAVPATEVSPTPRPVSPRPVSPRPRRAPKPRATPARSSSEPPFQLAPVGNEPTPRPRPRPTPTPAPRAVATPTPAPSLGGAGSTSNPWGAPTQTNGTLAVSTNPSGARVFVDGKPYGPAPARVTLPMGAHTVRVQADGYAPVTRTVQLQTTKVVTVDIVLQADAPAATGTLNVVTTPTSAMLYLDGVAKGRTPISVGLTSGSHEFKFQAEGKAPQTIRYNVQLKSGETKTKVFQLR